ncbi:hypothetical protein sscle_07g062000 [Sclerotinia sclerotiorum 1980 UF-70]|uniref:Mitochondrial division protein 1 n=1 Tax=Sclerotinia sclerotiorum (strain ATCC 18683 / 1980 / Ss-1) TaxID=665079 RepID=A0A1D9Q901_SCLS1|nr:hypothetical protein sscle_07g062000 [Sclerotinia sclerotiorum 1980 UF-70]
MSLMENISECIVAISSLDNYVSVEAAPELSAYVHDAKRFALRNRVGIEQAPLRIYCCWYEKDTEDVAPTDYVGPDTTGKSLQIFEGHSDWVNSVAFSPDKKVIVSGSDDGTIRFWDITTGKSLQVFEDHSGEVNSVAFSPDGKMVASVFDNKTIQLWNTIGESLQTLEGHSSLNASCYDG